MLIVALTGGIATGKSIVSEILKDLGCYIHNADLAAHRLMEPEKPAWHAIVNRFGEDVLNRDRTINRGKLGKIIFSNEKERFFLNRLLHPLVLKEKEEVIRRLEKEGCYKIFVSEAALTIEAGFTSFFDKIVVVYCHRDVQVKRLMERDRIHRKEALKKIQSQLPHAEKLKRAHYRINTTGTFQQTVEQTERVFRNLMMDFALKIQRNKAKSSPRK
jgi:dephospho-CoA kinase